MSPWVVPASIIIAGGLIGGGLYLGLAAMGESQSVVQPQTSWTLNEPPAAPSDAPRMEDPVAKQEAARQQLATLVNKAVMQNKVVWTRRCVEPFTAQGTAPPLPWKVRLRVATNQNGEVVAKGIHVDVGPKDLQNCLGDTDFLNAVTFPKVAAGVEVPVELP
ncbi:MAG: hypothetical protein HUU55_00580 [Myxococcales bacterium]|nr:hypothetical protein [Myxococcales bacterium]